MKKLLMLLTALTLASWSATASAYLPLVDNQPLLTRSCPLGEPIHTATSSGKIGYFNVRCVVDGVDAVYTVSVPPGCEKGGCGLVVDQHGMSMNAAQENAGTKLRQYGWVATRHGASTPYIVVQPNLTDLFDREKLIDVESVLGSAYYAEIANIAWFTQHLINVYKVDTRRTHMYGFSRGGYTVNAIYCEVGLRHLFASYAIGGMELRCPLDEPVLVMAGDDDILFPGAVDMAEAQVKAMAGVVSTAIVNDPGYYKPNWVFTWAGLQRKGRHHHMRFTVDGRKLETIRHSGSTTPLLGHCHPANEYNSWLVCYANMETGRKLIEFFIQNPR